MNLRLRHDALESFKEMASFELDDSGVMACLMADAVSDAKGQGEQTNGLLSAPSDNKWTIETAGKGQDEQIKGQNVLINGLINGPINSRQESVLGALRAQPNANYKELSDVTGISERTLHRDMAALVEVGLLRRVGSRKTGHWEVLVGN